MMNPYTNHNLTYPLNLKELKNIDNVWNFLSLFRESKPTRIQYRNHIISKIKENYNVNQFCLFEKILEKMYWNLNNVLKNKIEISQNIRSKKIDRSKLSRLTDFILKSNKKIKESTVRKAISYNDQTNEVKYKYSYPDDFDLIISSIMIDRSMYETLLTNPEKITLEYLEMIEPYHNLIEFDYPFPNLNTLEPLDNSDNDRIQKINQMYFQKHSVSRWFDCN